MRDKSDYFWFDDGWFFLREGSRAGPFVTFKEACNLYFGRI